MLPAIGRPNSGGGGGGGALILSNGDGAMTSGRRSASGSRRGNRAGSSRASRRGGRGGGGRLAPSKAAVALAQSAEEGIEDNPFKLPREDVFLMREREKQRKAAERQRQKKLRIWDKQPSHKIGASASTSTLRGRAAAPRRRRPKLLAAPDRMFQGRTREKENMAEFISKKRDMFLIQMSLDTKRQEITKLEDKAKMKEDALTKSEEMLEEDALRFDAFLRENDRKAHAAMRRAEQESKERQEKLNRIKKMSNDIAKVESEMQRYKTHLARCIKYKKFLDKLAPDDWLLEVERKKRLRTERIELRNQLRERAQNEGRLLLTGPGGQLVLRDGGGGGDGEEDEEEGKESTALVLKDSAGALVKLDDAEEAPVDEMYFKRTEQLLDIFAQLEERSLFLMTNVQETQESLEELKQKFTNTKARMEEKTSALQATINDLKQKIAIEDEKAKNLSARANANASAGNQQKLLAGLGEKVKEVYIRCFETSPQSDTLDMLREIEIKLEYLLSEIERLPREAVVEAEQKREADRRDMIRKKKKQDEQRMYEERLARSTARARAEVVRRTGKPLMFRSQLAVKKKPEGHKGTTISNDERRRAVDLVRFFQ